MNSTQTVNGNANRTRESDSLKLWIELIRCSNQLERNIDKKLRQQYGQSISRFDVLSQLEREQDNGLTVGDLGQKLIASKGNITGLVNRMIADGLLTKQPKSDDRRCYLVKISVAGLALFTDMAKNHASWIANSFQSLDTVSMKDTTGLLSEARLSLSNSEDI